ncbi:hypothetical protein MA3_02775 [Rickettsia prowazekii str. Dachau]|nr:hypothetical protein MA3_02775 [Rickettsia prowazekii str. Dachau]
MAPLNDDKTIIILDVLISKSVVINGTNITGPQKPVKNITKSITLLNFKATIIAKLPIITLIMRTINNNFF